MQRKDYELIAKAIVEAQRLIKDVDHDYYRDQLRGVRRTAAHLADALGSANPRFDATRFLKACGYGATDSRPSTAFEKAQSDYTASDFTD